jgi:VWFA-related protein
MKFLRSGSARLRGPMKRLGFRVALFCAMTTFAAAAQQNSGQNQNQKPADKPAEAPTEVQPQVWPPPPGTQPQQTPAPVETAPPAAASTPTATPGQAPALSTRAAENAANDMPGGQIRLDVIVTDKTGKPVTGLTQQDFTLLEDNHERQIAGFRAHGGDTATTDPVRVILIIDAVNAGFQDVSYSRYGIDAFLRKDGGRLAAPVAVYWYTDQGLQGQGPEGQPAEMTDGNVLAAQLDATEGRLRSLNRSAGAWGAIERFEMSVQTIDRIAHLETRNPGRKLIVWVGSGWPLLDSPNMQMTWKQQQGLFKNIVSLSTLLREGQIELCSVSQGMPDSFTYMYEGYTKGVKKASQAFLPDLNLKVLAVESGGQVLPPSNDLTAEIDKCMQDAGAYYTIGFDPAQADGPDQYHALKVKVDKPGLTARTDTGYYNEPPGTAQAQ